VVDRLNRYFSGLLIHSDPRVIRLEETFSRMANIKIPVAYTGFVTRRPASGARETVRAALGLTAADTLMLASAGSGKVGHPLLLGAVSAFRRLQDKHSNLHLMVFAGPFADPDDLEQLKRFSSDRVTVVRFAPDFLNYLAAADISLSMAGYNTCMNILTAAIPALVWPFGQNREQRLRAERLQQLGRLEILEDRDLAPDRLAVRIEAVLEKGLPRKGSIQLEGAQRSADWIRQLLACGQPRPGWLAAESNNKGKRV
jgi:predicted glycosyltransferase